jgi:bifunctional ADP-heptose synthase (sugar kinase/adenylyltransferase)
MSTPRILIVGESCRDVFVYCDALRIAPDVPIPVLHVIRQTENPGMAKNVERNVKVIYPACDIVTNENWREITKTRYMHDRSNHAFMRVDAGVSVSRVDVRSLPLADYDIVAISDYDKGFLNEDDIRYICENHHTVFLDTKKPVREFAARSLFIKINEKEYARSCPLAASLSRKIIMTKAERGAEFQGESYPVEQIEVKDSSGAGDTFFAALLVSYAEMGDIHNAIRFANRCASEVVQHRGVTALTGTASVGPLRSVPSKIEVHAKFGQGPPEEINDAIKLCPNDK